MHRKSRGLSEHVLAQTNVILPAVAIWPSLHQTHGSVAQRVAPSQTHARRRAQMAVVQQPVYVWPAKGWHARRMPPAGAKGDAHERAAEEQDVPRAGGGDGGSMGGRQQERLEPIALAACIIGGVQFLLLISALMNIFWCCGKSDKVQDDADYDDVYY